MLFPATMANFDIADWLKTAASWFTPSSILYNVIFIALIFFFCFFYTAIIFDPKDVAENLKKAGGFIPGIRPGEKTQEYLDAVLSRLTLWGGVYISVISVLPMLLIAEFNVPFSAVRVSSSLWVSQWTSCRRSSPISSRASMKG